MSRARNIKPSIMANEDLAELAPLERLLFVYLWMLADRAGRLEDRPRRIKAEALPYDEADVDSMLSNIESSGFIHRYRVGGQAVIQIVNFAKHQVPHVRERASELPGYDSDQDSAGITPGSAEPSPGQGKALDDVRPDSVVAPDKAVPEHNLGSAEASPRSPDSGFLIPDSGFLIPDSSSLRSDVAPGSATTAAPRRPRRADESPPKSAEPWQAYSRAYRERYGVDPVRNQRSNVLLCQLVDRLGAREAPAVAAFYLRHQKSVYVAGRHPIELLLRDAEAIRTDWMTGRQSTVAAAVQGDRTQQNANVFTKLIEEARSG